MDNNQNNQTNPYGLGLGEFMYIDNPNFIMQDGQPKRFFVKNWGNKLEITPRWN